jgi:hypothetical protein
MKGIMRKRLVAVLSAAGLAGAAASAASQVLKGAEPDNKAKTEKSIKLQKNGQENQAASSALTDKARKAGGEPAAASTSKQNIKLQKASQEKTSVIETIKLDKNASEANASRKATTVKGGKTAVGAQAARNEAAQKASQSVPK